MIRPTLGHGIGQVAIRSLGGHYLIASNKSFLLTVTKLHSIIWTIIKFLIFVHWYNPSASRCRTMLPNLVLAPLARLPLPCCWGRCDFLPALHVVTFPASSPNLWCRNVVVSKGCRGAPEGGAQMGARPGPEEQVEGWFAGSSSGLRQRESDQPSEGRHAGSDGW